MRNLLHRGDFWSGTHAVVSGSGTPEPQRLPAPGRKRPGGRGLDLPRCGSRRRRGTPHLAPSARRLRRRPLLSQDGESCIINALRSEDISSLRSRIRAKRPRKLSVGLRGHAKEARAFAPAVPARAARGRYSGLIPMTFTASAKICLSAWIVRSPAPVSCRPARCRGGLPALSNAVCSPAILCYLAVSHRPILQ
jgi:hypothetical protein